MKGVAALMMAAGMMVGLAGCCGHGHHDGMYDTADGEVAEFGAAMEQGTQEMNIMAPMQADVYAYVPPEPAETMPAPDGVAIEDGIAEVMTPDAVVMEDGVADAMSPDDATAGDGVVIDNGVAMGDGVADVQFDLVYEDLMSVMDLEDIGTRSTYRIIK